MTAFKRVIATALIALQLAQPVAAASFNFVAALKSQALKVVSETLAGGFGLPGTALLAERAMDAEMQAQALEAVDLFGLADQANGKSYGAELFDPGKAEQSSKQLRRWKALVAATHDKKTLSIEEMQEASAALLPFLRYINQGSAKKPDFVDNQVIVPTGATLRVNMQGFCMDRSVAAPAAGEKLQLVPIQKLLPQESIALYQAMMDFSAQHVEKRGEIQNLVWGLRHAADPYPPIKELHANQIALLDAAMPNGASLYGELLAKGARTSKNLEARKQLFRAALGKVQSKYGVSLPDPSAHGYSPSDANSLVAALTRMPVEGTPQANSDYSLLMPGVAAKTTANGLHNISVEIKNTTAQPYLFDANNYAGQSTRVSQRVAFGGLIGRTPGDNKNILQRLDDVLKMLEIEPLKNLQSQIQRTLDGWAEQPGSSDLKFAGLALATALNEVLLPVSAIDLLPGAGKLLGVAEKMSLREVLALEKAAIEAERANQAAKLSVAGVNSKATTVLPKSPQLHPNDLAELQVSKVTAPIDFEHVIGADYNRLGAPTGGHSLINGDVKIIPGTETAPNSAGVYKASVQMPDPKNPGQWIDKPTGKNGQSMFSKDWTEARIKVEVDAAWNNANKKIVTNKWQSMTPSGVVVEGYLLPKTTVYPLGLFHNCPNNKQSSCSPVQGKVLRPLNT